MTGAEAVEVLRDVRLGESCNLTDQQIAAIERAIEALSEVERLRAENNRLLDERGEAFAHIEMLQIKESEAHADTEWLRVQFNELSARAEQKPTP